jgi:hypothetical protein
MFSSIWSSQEMVWLVHGAAVGAGVGAGVGVVQNFFAPASQLQPTELQVDPGVPALGQDPTGNIWPLGQIELSH